MSATRPCSDRHLDPPATAAAGCTYCRLVTTNPHYRALWWPDAPPLAVVPAARPAPPASPCAYLGLETGERRQCPTCSGKVEIKLRDCTVHGSCTEAKPVPGVACCADCREWVTRPALAVRSPTNGIGDALLVVPVANGLQAQHPGADVWVRCPAGPAAWARLLWPRVTTGPLACPTVVCTPDKRVMDARRVPRWRLWAETAGTAARVPDPLPLPDAARAWAVPCAGRVLLAPFAAHAERTWPLRHWLAVERLLAGHGFACAVLDDRPGRCSGFAGPLLAGESPARVAAALAYAVGFAGNDSGMAHVAGFFGVPSVAVCHPASDRDIMGLYPGTESLHAPRVTPADVVAAVLRRVAAAVDPGFPAARFVEALHPADAWRRHYWPPVYAALWRTVRELAPRSVVEIGTRSGNGTWAILEAAPGCHVTTVDLPSPGEGGVAHGPAHARALLAGRPVEFVTADSTRMERLPVLGADLVYVDGGHLESTAYSDICLAERSGARAVLVDDFAGHQPVRAAVARFLRERPRLRGRFIPSQTGLFLLEGFPRE